MLDYCFKFKIINELLQKKIRYLTRFVLIDLRIIIIIIINFFLIKMNNSRIALPSIRPPTPNNFNNSNNVNGNNNSLVPFVPQQDSQALIPRPSSNALK